jgi:NADH-quinone oxidoreductase subunit I
MLIKREHGFLQRFYLIEILTGLIITMKQWIFGNNITYQYPEQRRQYSPRYRGQHYIKAVNGVENCTACMLCPTVCPADCIHIEAGERADKEKFPLKFEIDILRCCFCGFCEEACPKDAIKLSNIYEMADYERRVYDKDFLLIQRSKK